MKRKISVLIIVMILCMSGVVIFNTNVDVKAIGGGGEGDEGDIGLNFSYIEGITYDLSRVIFDAYQDGDLRKGRYFGSDGERYAADNILQDEMANMSLYDPCSGSGPYLEKIENINAEPYLMGRLTNLTEDLQPLSYGITIHEHNGTNTTNTTITDFHIEPMWNWRTLYGLAKYIEAMIEEISPWEVEPEDIIARLEKWGILSDYGVNMAMNENWLTKTVNYNNLSVVPRPTDFSWMTDFLDNESVNISNNESITDYYSLMAYIIPQFQIHYNFTFGELTPENAGTKLKWFDKVNWTPAAPPIGEENDFLYITEDNAHNPNYTGDPYYLKEWVKDWLANHSNDSIRKEIVKAIDSATAVFEMLLWNRTMENCKGVIKYNHDNSTYDMQGMGGGALNTLFINGSIGKPINASKDNYTVSFWINQSWNDTIDSYNVIGQINGTDQNKTVILSGLYDCWYNQGTVDGAIGIAIVMGIAKYMTDNDIKPKYNLKFVCFSGEEAGCRGAYYYDAKHYDENISMIIDLNQVGMDQINPPLTLNVYPNNRSTNDTVQAITNFTQYVERLDDGSNFSVNGVNVISNHKIFFKNQSRKENGTGTICFLKGSKEDGHGWINHHRSGENHQEGDVFKHYYPEDVNLTAEMVWNITKYYAVNPDCWFDTNSFSIGDSDDDDNSNDTVTFNFDTTSILPHDRVMINYSLSTSFEAKATIYETMNFSVNRSNVTKEISITLPEGESPGFYTFQITMYNSTGVTNYILNPYGSNSNQSEVRSMLFLYPYGYNLTSPNITNISDSPDPVGFGYDVTISADVTSNVNSSIDVVSVNVTYPDDSYESFNMSNTGGNTYEFVFNDTWQNGVYEYVIWARDVNGNESGSPMQTFNVSAQATISVCTVKDDYVDGEWINVTDPPEAQIGYELLDDGDVLRIWNKFDSYYFDTDNGIQLTNHYNNYWTHNVLMLGYYNNDVWNLLYRADSLSGFNKDIEFDGVSYVNATLWKDLTYAGYDFRLAVRYQLGVNDNELTVIPYIKNLGDEDIPYDLGFAWEMKDIQVDMTPGGDYIEISGESYYLNQGDLDETYTNLAVPCFYIRENITSTWSESLYLRWDENLNYMVSVKSRTGQYNAPVTLGIKIGTLTMGQEKYTSLFWHDASETSFYFDAYLSGVEEWTTNPAYMVDGNTSNFASTPIVSDVELCINNTCNGSGLGTISKVEIRAFGKYLGMYPRDIILRPVFIGGDGDNHVYSTAPSADWSQWFDITSDTNAPEWDWIRVRDLDCDVESGSSPPGTTVYCSKVEIRVTYNVNNPPCITAQYPLNGATGTGITPLLTVSVYDPEGNNMTISWLSNSSGSWQVFGTNNSVGNGTYHQIMDNASVNGQWWYWKVNISDGSNYVESSVHKFYTGYESKIVNTGNVSFKGFLLMQIQFYNNSSWVVADDTINDTSPRTMLWQDPGGEPGQHILGLDTVFNDLVNTSNLSSFGNGTYRIYAAFRDPDGNVLVCDDDTELIATYEFVVTFD